MHRTIHAALLFAVLLGGCGPILGGDDSDLAPVDPATEERVLEAVFAGLAAERAKSGPRFPDALPGIQDRAAAAAGFDDWSDFLRHVRATGPGRDLTIAQRINERMAGLLEPVAAPASVESPESPR